MSCDVWTPEVMEELIDTVGWTIAGVIVIYFIARAMLKE